MQKTLFVGDLHATFLAIEECWEIIRQVQLIAHKKKPNRIIFLGDQTNDHSMVDVRVLRFWREAIGYLSASCKFIYLLNGNHDRPNGVQYDGVESSLSLYEDDQVFSVLKPEEFEDAIALPYYTTAQKFYECLGFHKEGRSRYLICHQAIDGAVMANNFKCFRLRDSVDLTRYDFSNYHTIISGHIHTPQELCVAGKEVLYVGSPRWMNAGDAAVESRRFLYIDGDKREFIPVKTEKIPVFYKRTIETEADLSTFMPENYRPIDRLYLTISSTIDSTELKRIPNVRIKVVPPKQKAIEVKESEGIEVAFDKFLSKYEPPNNTPKEVLRSEYRKRIESGF